MDQGNSRLAYDLQELSMPAVSLSMCQQMWGYAWATAGMVAPGHVCAGEMSGRNICFGDSGGPLMRRGAALGEDVQLGVTSFTFPSCALPGMPGVFTFIPAYRCVQGSVRVCGGGGGEGAAGAGRDVQCACEAVL